MVKKPKTSKQFAIRIRSLKKEMTKVKKALATTEKDNKKRIAEAKNKPAKKKPAKKKPAKKKKKR